MHTVAPALLDMLAMCFLAALILERAVAVLCDPGNGRALAAASAILPATLRARLEWLPMLPLRAALTLGAALATCYVLPMQLLATVKPGVVPGAADAFVSALFITGLAQLLHQLFGRVFRSPQLTAVPFARLGFEPSDQDPPAPTVAFRLDRLGAPRPARIALAPSRAD